jgi:membrane fusion protein (multidrug efflux system)
VLPSLGRGANVSVSTPAYPGYVLSGTIDVVDPVLDVATRNVRVIARVPNPEGRFRPGMSADVSAVLASRPNALKVPNEAIFAEGEQFLVFVVTPDSSVAKTPVRLGSRFREFVEVVEGLQGGELVVRAGHQKLFPGAKVSWAPPSAPEPPSDAAGGATTTEEKSS